MPAHLRSQESCHALSTYDPDSKRQPARAEAESSARVTCMCNAVHAVVLAPSEVSR
jgi:hypothetical protein